MEAFWTRYRNASILTVALFAQLLLLGYQIRNDQDVRLIRLWGVTAITPVARALHETYGFVSGLWHNYVWLREAREESVALRAERDRLLLENQTLRHAVGAGERLQVLTSYQQKLASRTLVAEVIGAGANPNSRAVFLDKGSGAGVRPGLAVITPDGIVGKVQAVFPGASLVLLISDMYSAVGVLLENSRAQGVLKGTGLDEARIDYVPNEEKVTIGEKVYTSGQDRIYPKGLLVGTVHAIRAGRDFQEIVVQPGARLHRLEEVLVVTGGVHQDLPGTPQAPTELLPPPPPEAGRDPSALVSEGQPAASTGEAYQPLTDADRLKKRYQELGEAQGHKFGEGLPGSKPPDFNLGWSPPKGAPPKTPPAGIAPRAARTESGPGTLPGAVRTEQPAPPIRAERSPATPPAESPGAARSVPAPPAPARQP